MIPIPVSPLRFKFLKNDEVVATRSHRGGTCDFNYVVLVVRSLTPSDTCSQSCALSLISALNVINPAHIRRVIRVNRVSDSRLYAKALPRYLLIPPHTPSSPCDTYSNLNTNSIRSLIHSSYLFEKNSSPRTNIRC